MFVRLQVAFECYFSGRFNRAKSIWEPCADGEPNSCHCRLGSATNHSWEREGYTVQKTHSFQEHSICQYLGADASISPFVSQPNAVLSKCLCAGISCRSGCVLVISNLRCHSTQHWQVHFILLFIPGWFFFFLIAIVFYRDLCVVLWPFHM